MSNEQEQPPATANASESQQAPPPATKTQSEVSQKRAEIDTLPEAVAASIRETIRDAHMLLEFAVADGLAIEDEDAILAEIQKALRLLDPSRPLTGQDGVAFEKAYRKLAHTLSPLTIEEVKWLALPWWRRYRGAVLVSLVTTALAFLFAWVACPSWEEWLNCELCDRLTMAIGAAVWGFLFGLFLWWGAELFTGAVTNRKLNQLIRFCYGFTFLAIAFSVVPFLSISVFPALPRILALGPISVLQGCADPWPTDGANPAEIPKEIRCVTAEALDKLSSYKWLVNIGGEVVSVHGYQKREGDVKDQSCSVYSEDFREDRWRIQGGLAVPLYVIILALMGSAVSMTRKVPEYQRRAFGLHETLSNAQARENLVFQIMQVFSAPLIVMAAYYLLGPDTRTTSVLVGFASGFASEPILLAIRSLAEKLKPAGNEEPSPPVVLNVTIDPSSVTLSPGQSQLFTATVTNSTNAAVTWATDPPNIGTLSQTGLYTAPATIPADPDNRRITILAVSAADPTNRGSAMVSLIS